MGPSSVPAALALFDFDGTITHAESFARNVIPGLVRPEARERIAWHKDQGHTVVVVSASLDVYLGPWCRSLGLDLICTELEERDGILTGEYAGGDCYGAEKSRRVRARFVTWASVVRICYRSKNWSG